MKKVSVIIPCYNQSHYLFEAVQSVMQSTYQNVEIIVINDGSTDISEHDLNILLSSFENIILLNQDNSGICTSRNNGINIATGEYILPLDADDKIASNYIEEAVKILDYNQSVGIVYCEAELFGKISGDFIIPKYNLNTMLVDNCIFSCAMFRKKDWQVVGGYNPVMECGCEDWEFWLSLIELGKQPFKLNQKLFFYRQAENLRTQSTIGSNNYWIIRKNVMQLHPKLFFDNLNHIIFPLLIRMLGIISYSTKIKGVYNLNKKIFNPRNLVMILNKLFKKVRGIINSQKTKLENEIIKNNYKKVLKKIKKKEKIKVIFLCSECAKWSYQSVYEQFLHNPKFELLVALVPLYTVHLGKDKTRSNLNFNSNFFIKHGINVKIAYDTEKHQYISLDTFKPDIVFYEQPYDLAPVYNIYNISKNSLCMYSPYSYEILDFKENYMQNFHKRLFSYFVENHESVFRYEKYKKGNSENCVVVGCPKLDSYLKKDKMSDAKTLWKHPEKIRVIYAPHHSLEKDSLNFATFKQNGRKILELANQYDNTTWIFKPHPRLKYALLENKIMNEEAIKKYYEEWREIGNIFEEGEYLDIFKSSDVMITDSISFLAEYLPSQKPIIQLVNKKHTPYNITGEKIASVVYSSHSNIELEKLLRDIVINKNDEKSETRIAITKEIFDSEKSVSKKILSFIEQKLG